VTAPDDPQPLCVRQATEDDIPTVVRLINAAFAVERFFVDHDRIDTAEVARLFRVGRFLILEQAGAPLGCVYVELRGQRGYFGLLSVEPGRQGAGIGRRLVAAVEAECRAAGCTALDIQVVNLRTELPPIYRKLGFTEAGTAPFPASIPTTQPCHFVLMTKPLA
jgi:N-acetylglutamate synthase-like GNAT family acetyltransferase